MKKENNPVLEKSFEFALEIIRFADQLEEQKKYVISRQLLKCGTSIGANVREAQSSESGPDFVHKMKVAAKESEETEYWLQLCQHSANYPDPSGLIERNRELKRLLSAIISTSKSRLPK